MNNLDNQFLNFQQICTPFYQILAKTLSQQWNQVHIPPWTEPCVWIGLFTLPGWGAMSVIIVAGVVLYRIMNSHPVTCLLSIHDTEGGRNGCTSNWVRVHNSTHSHRPALIITTQPLQIGFPLFGVFLLPLKTNISSSSSLHWYPQAYGSQCPLVSLPETKIQNENQDVKNWAILNLKVIVTRLEFSKQRQLKMILQAQSKSPQHPTYLT